MSSPLIPDQTITSNKTSKGSQTRSQFTSSAPETASVNDHPQYCEACESKPCDFMSKSIRATPASEYKLLSAGTAGSKDEQKGYAPENPMQVTSPPGGGEMSSGVDSRTAQATLSSSEGRKLSFAEKLTSLCGSTGDEGRDPCADCLSEACAPYESIGRGTAGPMFMHTNSAQPKQDETNVNEVSTT